MYDVFYFTWIDFISVKALVFGLLLSTALLCGDVILVVAVAEVVRPR